MLGLKNSTDSFFFFLITGGGKLNALLVIAIPLCNSSVLA